MATPIHCDQCEIMAIDGFICHELGCPDAWQDETRDCRWCGSDFQPRDRDERFCSDDCLESYCS